MNSESISEMSVVILLVTFLFCFGKLHGENLYGKEFPQGLDNFVTFVTNKLEKMELLLREKSVRINNLESSLHEQTAMLRRTIEIQSNKMIQQEAEISYLKQEVATFVRNITRNGIRLHHLEKRVNDCKMHLKKQGLELELLKGGDQGQLSYHSSEPLLNSNRKGGYQRYELESTSSNANNITMNSISVSRHQMHSSTSGNRLDPLKSHEPPTDSSNTDTLLDIPGNARHPMNRDIKKGRHNPKAIPVESRERSAKKRVAPYHTVAFHAVLSTTTHMGVGGTIVYDNETLDNGNGYNDHDGIYTVPESGTYVITWTTIAYAHDLLQTRLIVNGAIRGRSVADADEINDIHSGTAVVVLGLNQGDHVYIRVGYTKHRSLYSETQTYAQPTFSGWKLH